MKVSALVVVACGACGVAVAQEAPSLSPKTLQAALAAKPDGAEAEKLAERVREYFGGSENLMKGAAPKVDELTVAWAFEAPQVAPNAVTRVVADVGSLIVPLAKVGTTGVYAGSGNTLPRYGRDVALRGWRRPPLRRRPARGLRNPPR